jgi:hypothetical protein
MFKIIHNLIDVIRCDQLKNKSSRRVTYGNPCYSIGSKANSIYFLNDHSVDLTELLNFYVPQFPARNVPTFKLQASNFESQNH